MEDNAKVRTLVELISFKEAKARDEAVERNPLIASILLEEDFSRKMRNVVDSKISRLFTRWQPFFDTFYKDMFHSHQRYLAFIIHVCICERGLHKNIFDSLLNVSILVNLLNDETLVKAQVNFSPLNVDIIMVLYDMELKVDFRKRGGFQQFVEFILHERSVTEEEEIRPTKSLTVFNLNKVVNNRKLTKLAKLVLSTSKVELPTLPSYPELIQRLVAFKKSEALRIAEETERNIKPPVKFEALNVHLQAGFSWTADSISNYDEKCPPHPDQYENIIQAVIRHNRSKSSSNEHLKGRMLEEASGVLEHFKNNIKSLIEVLDESKSK